MTSILEKDVESAISTPLWLEVGAPESIPAAQPERVRAAAASSEVSLEVFDPIFFIS
jgi:hypothetical protein